MGLELTDNRFPQTLQLAQDRDVDIKYAVKPLKNADHPNAVDMCVVALTNLQLD